VVININCFSVVARPVYVLTSLLSVSLITGIVYLIVLILAVIIVLNVLFKVLILLTLDFNYIITCLMWATVIAILFN